MGIKGFININKPCGMTSSDVVIKVKRKLRELTGDRDIRVGHMGTLDPAADGVLVIAAGTAARLFDYFLEKRKLYLAEFTFGETTDTLDRDGEIIERGGAIPNMTALQEAANSLTGEIMQIPPDYSAKSVGGIRAYDAARRGIRLDIPPKKVTVNSIDILSANDACATLLIDCLGGTYIRSIARDMGETCGTVAYMSALTRLAAGSFKIKEASGLDDFLAAKSMEDVTLIPLERELADMPRVNIDAKLQERIYNGVKEKMPSLPSGNFAVYFGETLFGVGCGEDGNILIRTRV